jgi:hypothetical protein
LKLLELKLLELKLLELKLLELKLLELKLLELKLQWKPLNVITLGPRETDHINRMITISQ